VLEGPVSWPLEALWRLVLLHLWGGGVGLVRISPNILHLQFRSFATWIDSSSFRQNGPNEYLKSPRSLSFALRRDTGNPITMSTPGSRAGRDLFD
jgi:hypothetical protein